MTQTALTETSTVSFPVEDQQEAFIRGDDTIIERREQFAREYAIMKNHLKQVGIEKFASEQVEIDKTFKSLTILRGEFVGLEQHINALFQYFDHYSPRSAEEMHSFINGYVNGAADAGGSVARRVFRMHDRLQQLLSMPETLLDTLGRRGGCL